MITARDLVGLSPTPDEVSWGRDQTRSEAHLLGLVVTLKCVQHLGYFPRRGQVPEAVVDHVRRNLGLSEETSPEPGSERTARVQRELVRERVGGRVRPAPGADRRRRSDPRRGRGEEQPT
ncbi:MAG: DUF4158 domain-containing protein [Acidimicrobiales bacterium]